MRVLGFLGLLLAGSSTMSAQPDAASRPRARDIGLAPGILPPGPLNAITDVEGVKVGQVTLWEGANIRTGVTAVLPHDGNLFQEKVPGAIYLGNAFGKLIGYSQVEELGLIETPIVLTNTLSVWDAANAIVTYVMTLPGNEEVRSINPVVGETNDGSLNDIRGRHVKEAHVLEAIRNARGGPVDEGVVGAGTGTTAFGWKGGIGTSSRRLPESVGGFTVGVLVQSNYGGVLQMDGLPVGVELGQYYLKDATSGGSDADGSIMMVVATDAPVTAHGLKRIAKRAMLGLSRTGATSSNGSGDYVIAFSTAPSLRSAFESQALEDGGPVVRNDSLSPLFQATIEATEEAVYNSMLKAVSVTGRDGNQREALPIDRLLQIGRKYNRLHPPGGGR
ncbi:MAG TPA: P1 family peptidase [Vicinamibacteria bacterium]|nr:P1 family peptidase [Vicinamibacteria bacterium]